MPNADFSTWSSPDGIAGIVKMWAEGNNVPKSGSFVLLKGQNGTVLTEFLKSQI